MHCYHHVTQWVIIRKCISSDVISSSFYFIDARLLTACSRGLQTLKADVRIRADVLIRADDVSITGLKTSVSRWYKCAVTLQCTSKHQSGMCTLYFHELTRFVFRDKTYTFIQLLDINWLKLTSSI